MSIGKIEIVLLLGKDSRYILKIYNVRMNWKVNKKIVQQKIKVLKMTQFPVNYNIVKKWCKIQGKKNNI